MADVIRCDGECGKESPDKAGRHVANNWMVAIVRRPGERDFRKHRLCEECARKNVFLPARGEYVSSRGFVSEVLN